MMQRKLRILGTGKYLPARQVTSEELDERLGKPAGWVLKKSGVKVRYYTEGETVSQMGARAAAEALKEAGLTFADLDCIVCTNSVPEQPIPCTAALIQNEMGHGDSGTPCFDVNSTCLSFLAGLDLISYTMAMGKYKTVLLVAPEIASAGLNYEQSESSILFGDGAAAVVVGISREGETSHILASRMETYGSGYALSEVRGGGTKLPAAAFEASRAADYLFDMQGEALFKKTSKLLPRFMEELFRDAGVGLSELSIVIPHQGSAMAMRLLQHKLGIPDSRLMNIIGNHGNTIAASLPMGLHEAIRQGRLERGNLAAIIGISAGVSLGGIVFEY
ncbi:beta-ketoacyl-ACP synthase III [Paenibacillus sp. N10]|uniref:Beta-ketoacyl-ACP synthase III n=2 Tax=Paenibacillus lutrae TaxID=2078573 RepID=A0A7X3K0J7_9BACL|nr:beta-ketoacyl-ACP synthase III [Paenibacillus lutrae]